MSRMSATPTARERWGVKNKLFGIMRGTVEYNLDPIGRGRVKIRIHSIHSTEKSIETADLPWAEPIHAYGGVHDSGSFIVPSVGATVWVMFEHGDPQHPLYIGSWYKTPDYQREINTKTSRETGRTLPTKPISEGTWKQPIGPEVPEEARSSPYFEPTTKVIYKSPKGHTIVVEDQDGREKIKIIDRLGQELVMDGAVTDSKNTANGEQRGLREVLTGDPVGYDSVVGKVATIELRGLSGQGIRVVSTPGSEFVELTSKDNSNLVSPDVAENRVSVRIGGSLGVFEIKVVSGSTETARLTIDAKTGNVELHGTGSMSIKSDILTIIADYLRIQGMTQLDGDLAVRGDVTVTGKITGDSL